MSAAFGFLFPSGFLSIPSHRNIPDTWHCVFSRHSLSHSFQCDYEEENKRERESAQCGDLLQSPCLLHTQSTHTHTHTHTHTLTPSHTPSPCQHAEIGPFKMQEPMILGHEASGIVTEVGENVKHKFKVRRGEREVLSATVARERERNEGGCREGIDA